MISIREENPVPPVPPLLRGLRPTRFDSLPIFPSPCHSLVPAPSRTDRRFFLHLSTVSRSAEKPPPALPMPIAAERLEQQVRSKVCAMPPLRWWIAPLVQPGA